MLQILNTVTLNRKHVFKEFSGIFQGNYLQIVTAALISHVMLRQLYTHEDSIKKYFTIAKLEKF